jgi:hypothetical protein
MSDRKGAEGVYIIDQNERNANMAIQMNVVYKGRGLDTKLDRRIEKAAKASASGSGCGFGERDLDFEFSSKTAAERAAKAIRTLKVEGLLVEIR